MPSNAKPQSAGVLGSSWGPKMGDIRGPDFKDMDVVIDGREVSDWLEVPVQVGSASGQKGS